MCLKKKPSKLPAAAQDETSMDEPVSASKKMGKTEQKNPALADKNQGGVQLE